ncbi:class I SAM-dependent methyltransferase [Treponema sp.]|uniref:class I SAM-dependent methyltransferase n=1 Tax=Treponema sp. TaxID=166 RepID=UPI00388E84E1
MLISATFSKPSKIVEEKLGKAYVKVRIWKNPSPSAVSSNVYISESFTEKQSFTKNLTKEEAEKFVKENAGKTFKNCVERTESEEITYLSNRRGEVRKLVRKLSVPVTIKTSKEKNYILKEGIPVPFLIELGVMTKEGKIVSSRYDKFRQINRFLEFIDDILGDVKKLCCGDGDFNGDRPLRMVDFGSGKSYLTFAAYYFLSEIKKIPCEVFGLDLKKDVIEHCANLARKYGYSNLNFAVGDIAKYSGETLPDIIVTLHACDTATDYALKYAVEHNTKAILSVPCCQHEINSQIGKNTVEGNSPLAIFMRHGILRERFAALATDAIRAELLEENGYAVQLMEFIDMEGTPKNLLIRAVKKQSSNGAVKKSSAKDSILNALSVKQTLNDIL